VGFVVARISSMAPVYRNVEVQRRTDKWFFAALAECGIADRVCESLYQGGALPPILLRSNPAEVAVTLVLTAMANNSQVA
jgi:hypothetical protein